jgi:signal transduction histidine kinase
VCHIAQEPADNAREYTCCSHIEIAIKFRRDGLILEVPANGRGFDPEAIPGKGRGLGLLSMEQECGTVEAPQFPAYADSIHASQRRPGG